ncbi:MAG: hypothetical protein Q8882_05580 [Bacillota bacterium]|nr:hypothetical protein [Bacillota bacterium]
MLCPFSFYLYGRESHPWRGAWCPSQSMSELLAKRCQSSQNNRRTPGKQRKGVGSLDDSYIITLT